MKTGRGLLAVFAAMFMAGTGHAGVCGPDRDTDIPEFELAKARFLKGDYDGFGQALGPLFQSELPGYADDFANFKSVFAGTFQSCHTVLQRREEPGFHQEVIFYFDDVVQGPVAMYLSGIVVDGEFHMVEFLFNTEVGGVLDALH